MSKKYLPSATLGNHAQQPPTIITNDLFMAAFLHSVGCRLDRTQRNERKRVSFVFAGERVHELRQAYRTGPVRLDMRLFRESLHTIRRTMDSVLTSACAEKRRRESEDRSMSHGSTRFSTGVSATA